MLDHQIPPLPLFVPSSFPSYPSSPRSMKINLFILCKSLPSEKRRRMRLVDQPPKRLGQIPRLPAPVARLEELGLIPRVPALVARLEELGAQHNSSSDAEIMHARINRFPLLSPISARYQNFLLFLRKAQALDQHHTGVIIVNCLPDKKEEVHNPLPFFLSKKCLQYQVQQQKDGVFEIATFFCKDVLHPTLDSSSVDTVLASDLLTKMEKLWKSSESLNDCQYLSEIDIKTPKQRSKAGFLPTCMV